MCKILKALISINAVDDVVGLLSEMGITGIEREKIPSRIDRMIADAEYMSARISSSWSRCLCSSTKLQCDARSAFSALECWVWS